MKALLAGFITWVLAACPFILFIIIVQHFMPVPWASVITPIIGVFGGMMSTIFAKRAYRRWKE